MMSSKYDVLILDGRHLLWRSSDAFDGLSVKQGARTIATGAIYGFLTVAIRVHERYGGRLVIAWEGDRSKNFRRKLYPDYKKKAPMDEEMKRIHEEMELAERRLKIVLRILRVDQYEGDGCEADDVIATVQARAFSEVNRIAIYTGDSDLRQLVCEMDTEVHVIAPLPKGKGDVIYDADEVWKKHGVMPSMIAELKALAGDSGDNIPGARGIGPKTALQLFAHFHSLQGVIDAAKFGANSGRVWPLAERHRLTIVESEEQLKMFLRLTTVKRAAKLIEIKPYPGPPDQAVVLETLKKLKFRSLVAPAELRTLMRLNGKDWS